MAMISDIEAPISEPVSLPYWHPSLLEPYVQQLKKYKLKKSRVLFSTEEAGYRKGVPFVNI